ncbi:hypothetical protein ACG7TL_008475 [Trametes sanguinea]
MHNQVDDHGVGTPSLKRIRAPPKVPPYIGDILSTNDVHHSLPNNRNMFPTPSATFIHSCVRKNAPLHPATNTAAPHPAESRNGAAGRDPARVAIDDINTGTYLTLMSSQHLSHLSAAHTHAPASSVPHGLLARPSTWSAINPKNESTTGLGTEGPPGGDASSLLNNNAHSSAELPKAEWIHIRGSMADQSMQHANTLTIDFIRWSEARLAELRLFYLDLSVAALLGAAELCVQDSRKYGLRTCHSNLSNHSQMTVAEDDLLLRDLAKAKATFVPPPPVPAMPKTSVQHAHVGSSELMTPEVIELLAWARKELRDYEEDVMGPHQETPKGQERRRRLAR